RGVGSPGARDDRSPPSAVGRGGSRRMRRRISVLVALGFGLLLGLGVLTSLAMIAGLRETMNRAAASQASALDVRASVRSLRADYLASSDAVSRLMLDPSLA